MSPMTACSSFNSCVSDLQEKGEVVTACNSVWIVLAKYCFRVSQSAAIILTTRAFSFFFHVLPSDWRVRMIIALSVVYLYVQKQLTWLAVWRIVW